MIVCNKNYNIVDFFNNYNDNHRIKHIIEHTETNISDVLELSEYQIFDDYLTLNNKNSIWIFN